MSSVERQIDVDLDADGNAASTVVDVQRSNRITAHYFSPRGVQDDVLAASVVGFAVVCSCE